MSIKNLTLIILSFLYLSLAFNDLSFALEDTKNLTSDVGIVERLNSTIDTSVVFTDSNGESKSLEELSAKGKPLIIVPAYYNCPRLCGLLLSGVTDLLNNLRLGIGKDYQIITLSFDPNETSNLASEKRKSFLDQLLIPKTESDWPFLVGSQQSINSVMGQIGFKYFKDGNEWAHAAVIVILTPDRKIARYFYGVEFPPKEVRLAIIEASNGKVGNSLDRLFLYCFRFDPTLGKYTPVVWRITQIVSALIIIALATTLIVLRLRERKNND